MNKEDGLTYCTVKIEYLRNQLKKCAEKHVIKNQEKPLVELRNMRAEVSEILEKLDSEIERVETVVSNKVDGGEGVGDGFTVGASVVVGEPRVGNWNPETKQWEV